MAKEYIEREAAIAALENLAKPYYKSGLVYDMTICAGINTALREVQRVPAADVRPVVTCRECKHRGWVQEPCHGKSVDYCRILDKCVDKEFFCAGGKRMEVQQ